MLENTTGKSWQTAFVSGVVACVITAVIVLGQALATAIVSIVSLIITVTNALLNLEPDKGGEPRTFSSFLKNMLYVGPLLKGATLVVWCGVLGLAAYGTLTHIQASRLVNIKGMVLTAQGTLAENARVTLVLEAGRELTEIAKDGKFRFEKVDTSQEPTGRVLLKARWQDTSGERAVDLGKGRPGEVTVTLSPGQPPFREVYLTLNEMALDQFLWEGELPVEWERNLAGKPYIIPNSQFNTLKSLLQKFSVPFADKFIMAENQSGEAISEKITARRKNTSLFIGIEVPFLHTGLESFQFFKSLLTPLEPWSISNITPVATLEKGTRQRLFRDQKMDPESSFFFNLEKSATREDLQKIGRLSWSPAGKKVLDYMLAVTENGMPPYFCELNLFSLTECGSGASWSLQVAPPKMELRVAVIENISSKPMMLQNFRVRENLSQPLRSRAADQKALEAQEIQNRDWFTPKILKPGEKIVVPLEISFFQKEEGEDEKKGREEALGPHIPRLDKLEQVAIPFPVEKWGRVKDPSGMVYTDIIPTGKAEFLLVPAQTLRHSLNRPLPPRSEREYIYGPSTKIESLEMARSPMPSGNSIPKTLSCLTTMAWAVVRLSTPMNLKPGLGGKKARSYMAGTANLKKGRRKGSWPNLTAGYPQRGGTGTILYRFFADQDSFPGGAGTDLLPNNPKLQQPDGDYLTLRRGEQLEVSFQGAAAQPGDKVYLVAQGYYLVEQKQ